LGIRVRVDIGLLWCVRGFDDILGGDIRRGFRLLIRDGIGGGIERRIRLDIRGGVGCGTARSSGRGCLIRRILIAAASEDR
jgi:hypothetical protein